MTSMFAKEVDGFVAYVNNILEPSDRNFLEGQIIRTEPTCPHKPPGAALINEFQEVAYARANVAPLQTPAPHFSEEVLR